MGEQGWKLGVRWGVCGGRGGARVRTHGQLNLVAARTWIKLTSARKGIIVACNWSG